MGFQDGVTGMLKLPSKNFTASSFQEEQYRPASAFDGVYTNKSGSGWWSDRPIDFPQWIQVDLGGEYRIGKVKVENGMSTYAAKSFTIEYSLDGIDFKECMSESNLMSEDGAQVYEFNPCMGRFFRIVVKSGYHSDRVSLAEVEFYESPFISKLLLEAINGIYTYSNLEGWQGLEITGTPSKLDFEAHGMSDLSIIPKEKLDELTKPYSVLTWTDKEDAVAMDLSYTYGEHETKWLYTNTNPFSPLDRLNEEDEFEVLTYSDEADEVPTTTVSEEGTIDSGKLFTATLDDFDTVTGVEVK